MLVVGAGPAVINQTVTGCTFQNSFGPGMHTQASGNSTITTTIGDDLDATKKNSFTNNGYGIQISAENTADVTFDIGKNTFREDGVSSGGASTIGVTKASLATGTVSGKIIGNTFGIVGVPNSGSPPGSNAIALIGVGASGDYNVQISDNTIHHSRAGDLHPLRCHHGRHDARLRANYGQHRERHLGRVLASQEPLRQHSIYRRRLQRRRTGG